LRLPLLLLLLWLRRLLLLLLLPLPLLLLLLLLLRILRRLVRFVRHSVAPWVVGVWNTRAMAAGPVIDGGERQTDEPNRLPAVLPSG
jgi:hypothetical protein